MQKGATGFWALLNSLINSLHLLMNTQSDTSEVTLLEGSEM